MTFSQAADNKKFAVMYKRIKNIHAGQIEKTKKQNDIHASTLEKKKLRVCGYNSSLLCRIKNYP